MIIVFGSINVDLVARVAEIARPGETVLAPGYDTFFGGKGANQAVAAARASDRGVMMVGAVGDDSFGQGCLGNFAAHGVDTAAVHCVDAPTGLAFISVDRGGENAITVASGANGLISAQWLDGLVIDASTICVMQMEVSLAENLSCARRVRAAGGKVILNFAPAGPANDPQGVDELLQLIDILVVNEPESEAIGRHVLPDSGTPAEMARRIGCDLILTRGASGVDLHGADGSFLHEGAPPIAVIDTTGAGDTFVGALAAALDGAASLPQAVATATRAASQACTWNGAQPAPNRGRQPDP
ncbi:ribokinase [uncultured Paracoccus sp.]|uniref:ribokinase n=1 Tax=uncultured Paracoccus sp. TaxID=189685 RepID=UPI0025DB1DA2|nr:ribokinase [uncultured Paracoccus sp.]